VFGGRLVAAANMSFVCEGRNPVAVSGRNDAFMGGRNEGRFYRM